ncbi:hypothetical protein ES703_45039 [subsurface metagenome]
MPREGIEESYFKSNLACISSTGVCHCHRCQLLCAILQQPPPAGLLQRGQVGFDLAGHFPGDLDGAAVAGGADEEGEGLAVGVVGAQADADGSGVGRAGEGLDLLHDDLAAVGLLALVLGLQALAGFLGGGQAGLVLSGGLELALGGSVGLLGQRGFELLGDHLVQLLQLGVKGLDPRLGLDQLGGLGGWGDWGKQQ